MWRFLIGDIAKDGLLGKAMDQHLTLLAFRFHHLTQVRNTREAEAVVNFTEANDEEIGAMSKCGSYFDVSELRVKTEKLPGGGGYLTRILVAAALSVIAAIAATAIIPREALVRYKPTGDYYWLSEERVRGFGSPVRLINEQCVSKTFSDNAPPADVRDAMCELLGDPKAVKQHLDTLPVQRYAFLVIALAAGVPGTAVWRNFSQAINASVLAKRLKERAERVRSTPPKGESAAA